MGSHQQLGSGVGSCLKSFEREVISFTLIAMASADDIKKICEIYDWDGKGVFDMYYLMDVFYALGMNIIKKVCVKYGQTDDTGNYHDYVELCKLYDKNENGTMMLAELENFLVMLGDEIPKEDVGKLLDELADKEDEDGFIPYKSFLDRLCGKA